jgi:hypothetical protein
MRSNEMEAFILYGAIILRQFEYMYPVDKDGTQIPFNHIGWEMEIKESIKDSQVLILEDGFVVIINSKMSDGDINSIVINIMRKYLPVDIGGIFYGHVENETWKGKSHLV